VTAAVNQLRCFYRCGENGSILDVVQTHLLRGEGWFEATDDETLGRVLRETERWRADPETGELSRKPHIRLRVNDPVFKADGIDEAVWIVTALDAVPEGAAVRVTVNGDAQEWRFGELHAIASSVPGTWIVALADGRYWAEHRVAVATAHPTEAFGDV
jgi:hypothetical protein